MNPRKEAGRVKGKWIFLIAFCFSCFLFWWLRSLLVHCFLNIRDAVEDGTIAISVIAFVMFTAGYLLPVANRKNRPGWLPGKIVDS